MQRGTGDAGYACVGIWIGMALAGHEGMYRTHSPPLQAATLIADFRDFFGAAANIM